MHRYNGVLARAGVLLGADRIDSTADGASVRRGRESHATPAADLSVGGYSIWQCTSLDEAIHWARRYADRPGPASVLDILPVVGPEVAG